MKFFSLSTITATVATLAVVGNSGIYAAAVPPNDVVVDHNSTTLEARALGINCQGSSYCTGGSGRFDADILLYYISTLPDNVWYNNGQQIACTAGAICAFLQNTGGAWSSKIKSLAPYISDHGCKVCGSVPYYYPGDNNVANGQLTYNWVSKTCNTQGGLC